MSHREFSCIRQEIRPPGTMLRGHRPGAAMIAKRPVLPAPGSIAINPCQSPERLPCTLTGHARSASCPIETPAAPLREHSHHHDFALALRHRYPRGSTRRRAGRVRPGPAAHGHSSRDRGWGTASSPLPLALEEIATALRRDGARLRRDHARAGPGAAVGGSATRARSPRHQFRLGHRRRTGHEPYLITVGGR